mmetsp:Transcript_59055/g.80646  ORF Transcript_59055/g.80646 Transcript_59055/m.80646 type:complete len:108 (+) Transcript_59055:838-1161(+)
MRGQGVAQNYGRAMKPRESDAMTVRYEVSSDSPSSEAQAHQDGDEEAEHMTSQGGEGCGHRRLWTPRRSVLSLRTRSVGMFYSSVQILSSILISMNSALFGTTRSTQ